MSGAHKEPLTEEGLELLIADIVRKSMTEDELNNLPELTEEEQALIDSFKENHLAGNGYKAKK